MPSVDVVVPCYNYAAYLDQCVGSVLAQNGVDLRVLILDDCSTDDTPEVGRALARADARVTFRRHARNAGHIATYNEGIAWAEADYFLLLSADDYLLEGALERAARLLGAHKGAGFAFGRALVAIEGRFHPVRPLPPASAGYALLSGPEFYRRSGALNIVPTPTAVVRTGLQKAVGGYRADLPHSGDMEMWLRLAARAGVLYVDDHQAVYRQHATNMSHAHFAGMLPDFEQRRLALDHVFAENSDRLPQAARLQRRLMRDLARRVLEAAGLAFNGGNEALAARLADFAGDVDPGARWTAAGIKLAVKRRLGERAWRRIATLRGSVMRRE